MNGERGMMIENVVKSRLQRGELALGAWLNLPSLAVARLMARQGFHWLTVDAEHGAQHPGLIAEMVATIADSGVCAPLVRLPTNSVEWYKWALDAGAFGVVVPMVNNREDAERAVSWSRYPPEGMRSIGGAFAHYAWGAANRADYAAAVNRELLVIVQIESAQALANLDEILSVPGIDVAFVGPNDLHAQLGLAPRSESDEPAFVAALERIKAAARRYNLALGIYSSDGVAAAQRVREGFQMVSITSDVASLTAGALHNLTDAGQVPGTAHGTGE
ncbi:MAG: hypothetical protein H0X37_12120 [Herpetosiphonaceae bacterium]|nr:hypothetical protein [Herpetosiphonaceae bacterium]